VTVPVLVVTGDEDEVVPPANSSRLVAALRHARLVVYKDAGYASLFEDESAFVEAVTSFVPPTP
jgi:pimeloyl-ACP methyl ester carboxylesterase